MVSSVSGQGRRRMPAKQVRLKLVYVDFWSAVKFSFMIALCISIINTVTSILLYFVLVKTSLFATFNELFTELVGDESTQIMNALGVQQVILFFVIMGVLNLVIGTVLGAVASLIYNLLVRVLGGFQLGFTSS